MPQWVVREIDAFVDVLGGTGRILEIGSGGGRDACELERRGLLVRCTDVAQGFVDLLRADSFEADQLDPLTDDLADPRHPDTPYDGVWSCACLFHVARDDLVTVLGRLAAATGPLDASTRRSKRATATFGPPPAPIHAGVTPTRCGGSRACVRSSLPLGRSWTKSVPMVTSRGSPYAGIDREDWPRATTACSSPGKQGIAPPLTPSTADALERRPQRGRQCPLRFWRPSLVRPASGCEGCSGPWRQYPSV